MTLSPWARPGWKASLAPPVVLLWIGILATVALSVLAYAQHYWILPRQWVGGISLVTIAVVWLVAEMSRASQREPSALWRVPIIAFVVLLIGASCISIMVRAYQVVTFGEPWAPFNAETRDRATLSEVARKNGDWVYVANVSRGGLGELAQQVGPGLQLAGHDGRRQQVGDIEPLVRAAERDQGVDAVVAAEPLHVVPGDESAERVPDDVDPVDPGRRAQSRSTWSPRSRAATRMSPVNAVIGL